MRVHSNELLGCGLMNPCSFHRLGYGYRRAKKRNQKLFSVPISFSAYLAILFGPQSAQITNLFRVRSAYIRYLSPTIRGRSPHQPGLSQADMTVILGFLPPFHCLSTLSVTSLMNVGSKALFSKGLISMMRPINTELAVLNFSRTLGSAHEHGKALDTLKSNRDKSRITSVNFFMF